MNISNNIKNKIINHERISKETSEEFLRYMIFKSIIITEHMYNNIDYKAMYLFKEICYSYNLKEMANDDNVYSIVNIGEYKYLVDLEFNNNKIPELSNNKYIEYNEDLFKEYLKILKEGNDNV
jgi:hypothetical protein